MAMRAEAVLQKAQSYDAWFKQDAKAVRQLHREVIEFAQACKPDSLCMLAEALVRTLATGRLQFLRDTPEAEQEAKVANKLVVNGTSFENRAAVKKLCRDMIAKYQDGELLNQGDADFMKALLKFHARGDEKLRDLQAVSVGYHEGQEARVFFAVKEGSREDFSYVRCVDNAPTREMVRQDAILDVLHEIVLLHPSPLGSFVCKKLADNFPGFVDKRVGCDHLRNYTRCMLRFIELQPTLMDYLLKSVVMQLIRLDLSVGVLENSTGQCATKKEDQERLAQLLDSAMMALFEFFQRHLTTPEQQLSSHQLVSSLFNVFESQILVTPKCRYVQFLVFYVAGLTPLHTEAFLMCVLRRAYSHKETWYKRQMSFAYMSSFTARAAFLQPKFHLQVMLYVCIFLQEHLGTVESMVERGQLDTAPVLVYLSAVNSVCYMLTFRGPELLKETDEQGNTALSYILPSPDGPVRNDSFTPILQSRMKVLERIDAPVAQQFCRTIRPLCNDKALASLLEVPDTNSSLLSSEAMVGPDFPGLVYPFEPYGLYHSHMFVKFMYLNWDEVDEDSDEDEDVDMTKAAPLETSMEVAPVRPAEVAGQDGFKNKQWEGQSRYRAMSAEVAQEMEDGHPPDADFIDATDAQSRGFIPSVGPSPAFRPRHAQIDSDMPEISPLASPYEGDPWDDDSWDEDDDLNFVLPQSMVPAGYPDDFSSVQKLQMGGFLPQECFISNDIMARLVEEDTAW